MEATGMEEETKTTTTTTTTTPEGENRSKRKMKTASQLEILEKTYSEETYPSEALRVELSAKLGLSDRQLQMWFCHRRLKDRKPPSVKRSLKDSPVAAASPGVAIMTPKSAVREDVMLGGGELGNEHVLGSGSASSRFGHGVHSRRVVPRAGVAMARIGADVSAMRRYYEPQQSIIELRAIAFVEAQLGETLREDGPILGMEFDPLPPDAFGALIGTVGQQKQTGQPYETKIYERPDAKSAKGAARALHEYQFLPEQPTVRTDSYERGAPSHYYGSPADGPSSRVQSLSTGRPFMHGNEQIPSGYGFQGRIPSLNLLPQQGMQGHVVSSVSGDYDSVSRKNSFASIGGMDALFGPLSVTAVDSPLISSERRVSLDEDVSRMERKRKGDEARIAREVEAHEKRIRKELERQDILRRKREEQMKKEMERHDRERRKEEERLLREKQREEERYQREQRRELERKEKFLQKESIRVERVRQKEELRREKEAARLKAANERAIARRIAKESTELIEDERLELMELAASSKGLPSILALDYETLQNLELFRDLLSVYPPRSVPLKKPFAVQPWTDSEENTGNLLMVWRFIITFADVLGLWPFTLDEFVQAFHDYDSRLLGEIHMALLRSIIKDIEDVARTPSSGLGTNQNTAANPGGGHPQIVEGAYAWGFDIRSWQRNLNPLTWPEILRQFSLSAGFGPKLKKRNVDPTYLRDDNDGNNGEDVISILRNGVAAGKAVAIMQERGYSHPRRSKNRLTPGTVKFAAFHVLSLEGSDGLTILEVADKIQRSGLRDLTTNKTPEASIAAALSRDANLFERTAPSTYCIRPAYRKDPADAEAILSAARERIRVFKSGFLDGEEAEDVERDEDSESDVAEDPEVDDLGNESNLKKEAKHSFDADKVCAKISLENGMETPEKIMENLKGDIGNVSDSISSMHSEGFNMVKSATEKSTDVDVGSKVAATPDQEDTDIDESNSGEAWVQGLIDGEYSDLSVEERLIALVALIGVAVEGNSIRIVLEERLEAANALKKQMWAEAQLDKRRMKDEYVMRVQLPSFVGNKTDPSLMTLTAEVKQSPMAALDENNNALSVIPSMQQEPFSDLQNDNSYLDNVPSDRNLLMQDFSAGLDNLPLQQPGLVAERSRSQLKSYIGHKAEEMYVYRSLPLGQDRRRNRYWQFMASASRNDPGSGRIFVELREGCWRLIDSEETFDALLSSLDVRGMRESHLHSMLQKVETCFKESVKRSLPLSNICSQTEHFIKREASEIDPRLVCSVDTDSPSSSVCIPNSELEPSSSFSIELGRNEAEKINAFKRYQEFQKWMWKECLSASNFCAMKYGKKRSMQLLGLCDCCHSTYFYEDKHCPSCHNTFGYFNNNVNFSEHVAQCDQKVKLDPAGSLHGSDPCPLRIRLLKVLLALIEVSIPLEALQPVWTDDYRKSWGMKLWNSSSADDLLQILAMLENAIKREHLSLNFETTFELLGSCSPAIKQPAGPERVPVLPWVPQTTAAVALRLVELDASISYMLHQKLESQKDNVAGDYIKLPSKYAVVKNFQEDGFAEALHETEILQEDWLDPAIGYSSLGRGRGGRGRDRNRIRGGRSQRRVNNSRPESGRRGAAANTESFGQLLGWKRRTRGQGGRRRGRRTARSRQRPAKRVLAPVGKRDAPEESIFERAPEILGRDEWNVEITEMQVEDAENASSSERSEYADYNGQGTGDEHKAIDDFAGVYNGKSLEIFEASDDNINGNEDDDINYEDGEDEEDVDDDEDEQADIDIEGFINGYSDDEDNMDEDARQNGVPGEGTGSTSSDYSD